MRQKVKVAFAHSNISHNTQGIMAGITDYIRDKGDWDLIIWADASFESLNFLKERGCRGTFANIQTSAKAQQLQQIGMPVIAFNALQNMLSLPYISADPDQIAQVAYDYFKSKKFTHFGFFGLTEARWSIERMESFSRLVEQAGETLHTYKGGQMPIKSESVPLAKLWIDMILHKGQQPLLDWLANLPKPIAILVGNDILACHLSNVAAEAGLNIPDEIALLGIDDDQALCNLCNPPLSSIAFNFKKAGYDAARLMDDIISGRQTLRGQWIKIQTAGVKERGSTDICAVEDEDIIKALKYIRSHCGAPLQVEDIADHICISKRTLQMKFQKALGRSIHEEIIKAHVELAKALLIETNLSVETIALRSGFHYSSNMRRAFLDITGMLPHKYRQTHRAH
jgi:LacI family transcriptional regulator